MGKRTVWTTAPCATRQAPTMASSFRATDEKPQRWTVLDAARGGTGQVGGEDVKDQSPSRFIPEARAGAGPHAGYGPGDRYDDRWEWKPDHRWDGTPIGCAIVVSAPPFGAVLAGLPRNCIIVWVGGVQYYWCDSVFLRPWNARCIVVPLRGDDDYRRQAYRGWRCCHSVRSKQGRRLHCVDARPSGGRVYRFAGRVLSGQSDRCPVADILRVVVS